MAVNKAFNEARHNNVHCTFILIRPLWKKAALNVSFQHTHCYQRKGESVLSNHKNENDTAVAFGWRRNMTLELLLRLSKHTLNFATVDSVLNRIYSPE